MRPPILIPKPKKFISNKAAAEAVRRMNKRAADFVKESKRRGDLY